MDEKILQRLHEIFGVSAVKEGELFGVADSALCQMACLLASDMSNKTYLECMKHEMECAIERMMSGGTTVGEALLMKLLLGAIIMKVFQANGSLCDDSVKVLIASVDTICDEFITRKSEDESNGRHDYKDSGEDNRQGNDR